MPSLCTRDFIVGAVLIVGVWAAEQVFDVAHALGHGLATAGNTALDMLTWAGVALGCAAGLVVLTLTARYIQRRQQARGACLTCRYKCQAAASREPVPVQIERRALAPPPRMTVPAEVHLRTLGGQQAASEETRERLRK